jgi:hypothetical protein
LDNTGSMSGLREKAREFANDQIGKVKLAAADSDQITELSIMLFGEPRNQRWLTLHAFPQAAPLVARHDYTTDAPATALYEAVRHAVLELEGRQRVQPNNDASNLIIVITDGDDTVERSWGNGLANFGHFLKEKQQDERWSFAFLGPARLIHSLGRTVPAGNLVVWEQTEAGLEQASHMTSQGIGGYYSARAAGQTKTTAFFTELGKVSKTQVQKRLGPPRNGDFKRIPVSKETTIREAVEEAGERFRVGAGFYELTKPERVQSHKEFLLMERKGGNIYSGAGAREILGISDGPGVTVKVTPGNHGDWRVFVSSTSTNRKLVRGTTLLYKVR